MSLIFDKFPTREHADKFALDVCHHYGLDATVFASEEDAFEHDPFPFDLTAPIVHVERPDVSPSEDEAIERYIERLVTHYGGAFAGT
jgi:hypothetical protein